MHRRVQPAAGPTVAARARPGRGTGPGWPGRSGSRGTPGGRAPSSARLRSVMSWRLTTIPPTSGSSSRFTARVDSHTSADAGPGDAGLAGEHDAGRQHAWSNRRREPTSVSARKSRARWPGSCPAGRPSRATRLGASLVIHPSASSTSTASDELAARARYRRSLEAGGPGPDRCRRSSRIARGPASAAKATVAARSGTGLGS